VPELDLIVSGVTGALTGGVVRPLLAPFVAVGDVWTDRIKDRIVRTGERVERKRQGREGEITERTAVHALAAAALTDDEVVQEYLAGVVACASADDDNSHMLALISRLTPLQLRLHYDLHLSAAAYVRSLLNFELKLDRRDREWLSRWERANAIGRGGAFVTLITDPGLPGPTRFWPRAQKALDHLDREQLINLGSTFADDEERPIISFQMTEFGMELFASALGLDLIAFGDFCNLDPKHLLLDPPIDPMATRSGVIFHEEWNRCNRNDDFDNTWKNTVGHTAAEHLAALEDQEAPEEDSGAL
jgi:hypothetical protein